MLCGVQAFPTALQQLQQRAWLVHWALFVFFNHPAGRTSIIDVFFQDRCAVLTSEVAAVVLAAYDSCRLSDRGLML